MGRRRAPQPAKDPLEAMKDGEDTTPEAPEEEEPTALAFTPGMDEALPGDGEDYPWEPEVGEAEDVAPPAPALPPVVMPRYRVLETRSFSHGVALVTWPKGKIVSEAMDPQLFRHARMAEVPLELVPE